MRVRARRRVAQRQYKRVRHEGTRNHTHGSTALRTLFPPFFLLVLSPRCDDHLVVSPPVFNDDAQPSALCEGSSCERAGRCRRRFACRSQARSWPSPQEPSQVRGSRWWEGKCQLRSRIIRGLIRFDQAWCEGWEGRKGSTKRRPKGAVSSKGASSSIRCSNGGSASQSQCKYNYYSSL